MGKFFTIDITPDVINGTVAGVIQSDKTDLAFAVNDLVFDWTAVDVPSGSKVLKSASMYIAGEDGGVQAAGMQQLIFAKSINKEAPSSLGAVNAAPNAGFTTPLHFVGACNVGGYNATFPTSGQIGALAFGTYYMAGSIGPFPDSNDTSNEGGSAMNLPIVIDTEPGSGTNVGYDKLYVAMTTQARLDFSTGVLSTGAISADTQKNVPVDTVDPQKCFQVGDIIYVHDVDTALGTIASIASGEITLEANNAAAVANNDEIVNANPIRIKLGFER